MQRNDEWTAVLVLVEGGVEPEEREGFCTCKLVRSIVYVAFACVLVVVVLVVEVVGVAVSVVTL